MNLILFEQADADVVLPRSDPRAVHLLEVLRRKVGETFDAGVVNGPKGKGTLTRSDAHGVSLQFAWGAPPPPPEPIILLVGLPRPQTARDILRDATALGVCALHFFQTDRGEPSYAQATLWTSGEWRRHLLTGAEQAFDTRIPELSHARSLEEVLAALPAGGARLALDNYESPASLSSATLTPPVALAFGAERGWSPAERDRLRAGGFSLCHLGPRVLRCETAVVAAVAVVRSRLGRL